MKTASASALLRRTLMIGTSCSFFCALSVSCFFFYFAELAPPVWLIVSCTAFGLSFVALLVHIRRLGHFYLDFDNLSKRAQGILDGKVRLSVASLDWPDLDVFNRAFLLLARKLQLASWQKVTDSDLDLGLEELQQFSQLRREIDRIMLETKRFDLLHQLAATLLTWCSAKTCIVALFLEGKLIEVGYQSTGDDFVLSLGFSEGIWDSQRICSGSANGASQRQVLALKGQDGVFGFVELLDRGRTFGRLDQEFMQELSLALATSTWLILQAYREEHRRLAATVALRDSEVQVQSLAAESPDAILTLNIDGTIGEANRAANDLLAQNKTGLLPGKKIQTYLLNAEDLTTMLRIVRSGKHVGDFELIVGSHGREIFTTAALTPIYHNGTDFEQFYLVLRDISERVKFSQDLLLANMELNALYQKLQTSYLQLVQQEKLASIGQLAAGIAHEINNPLGFVRSNLGMLQKYQQKIFAGLELIKSTAPSVAVEHLAVEFGLNTVQGKLDSLMSETMTGLDRITTIVKSLKAFSRIDSDGSKAAAININDAVQTTITVAHNEYRYIAELSFEPGDVPILQCFGDQLNQVLLNLLVNASQAIKSQARTELGQIHIKTYLEKNGLVIEIKDDGPGMSNEVKARIFEPFYTTKDVGEGTGLGLSISRDIIVNKHGGKIEVESQLGLGCRFKVWLPLDYPDLPSTEEALSENVSI